MRCIRLPALASLVLIACEPNPTETPLLETELSNSPIVASVAAAGAVVPYFGPVDLVRDKGKPVSQTISVGSDELQHFTQPFTLRVRNGAEDGSSRVSAATITLDGVQLFGPSDFSQQVAELSTDVAVAEHSDLNVKLASAVGSFLTIWIDGMVKPGHARVGPEGGTYTFHDGLVLEFTPGVVNRSTWIKVDPLPMGELQTLLDARPYRSHAKTVLGGFLAAPDGLVFQAPVHVSLPIQPQGGVPVQAEVDFGAGAYWLTQTDLIYDPRTGLAQFDLSHFSAHAVLGLSEIDGSSPTEVNCTELRIRVVVEGGDFSGGQGCQIVGETVEVTFLDCPGSPAQLVHISETTPECGDDFELTVEIESPATVPVCRSAALNAVVTDKNGKRLEGVPMTWWSSAPQTAPIDKGQGDLTGMKEGYVEIDAVTPDIRFYGTAPVTIVAPPPIKIEPPDPVITVGQDVKLEALDDEGEPFTCEQRGEDGLEVPSVPVTWSTDDPDVATVVSDVVVVRGISAGKTTLTATSGEAEGSTTVTVGATLEAFFVVNNYQGEWQMWYPEGDGTGPPTGITRGADALGEALEGNFSQFRVGIETFDIYPQLWYVEPWDDCWWDWVPIRAFDLVQPFTDDGAEFTDAWRGMRVSCTSDRHDWHGVGSTSYSALMHAINQDWSENADITKVIFLITRDPPEGPFSDEALNGTEPEPITGLTQVDVIDAANAKNIKIYVLETGYASIREAFQLWVYASLAQGTGGEYIQIWDQRGLRSHEAYKAAIEVLRQLGEQRGVAGSQ